MDQCRPPAVFDQPPRGCAELLHRTALLTPRRAAGIPAPFSKPRRVGDHQIKISGREQGPVPQIAGEHLSAEPVESQVPPRQFCRRRLHFHPREFQLLLPLQQEESQRPGAAAQITDPKPPPHGGEPAQIQGVRSQREHPLRLKQHIAPQSFHPFHRPQPLCGIPHPHVVYRRRTGASRNAAAICLARSFTERHRADELLPGL